MAEGKSKVIWYTNWGKTFLKLSDDEAGKLIKHFCAYVMEDQEDPEAPDRLTELMFDQIQETLKRDLKAWEKKQETNRTNGAKGGRPKKPKLTQANPEEPNGLINNPEKGVKDKVKVNDNVKDNKEVDSTTAKAIDFDNLLAYINKTFGREFKIINDAVKTKYKARVKEGYTSENIREAINNCKKDPYHIETNYKYCTPEFFSRSVKLDLHSSIGTPEKSSDPMVDYVNQHIAQYGNS